MLREINFDGIVGPTHNFAGLSLGNMAAQEHAGETSSPRAAALQGIVKMRANLALGLVQGILPPHARPNHGWLATLGTNMVRASTYLQTNALSASAMWAANIATVSPGPDTQDGRCHMTVANLMTMAHRSHEWPEALRQLNLAFADNSFAIHGPVPPPFGDEGAANHMRLCMAHGEPGVEIFVYGRSGGRFPARQHVEACRAIARRHGLIEDRIIFAEQSPEAIAAGAFHNDVVGVANENVLFAHEMAFADPDAVFGAIQRSISGIEIIVVPTNEVSLTDAVSSYLFNAQLVTLPEKEMALILPMEAKENASVWSYLQKLVGQGPSIRKLVTRDLRQSMNNGGGPACLRLRVVADPATIDHRFLVDDSKLSTIEAVIQEYWPESIAPSELFAPSLWSAAQIAREALLESLGLTELIGT